MTISKTGAAVGFERGSRIGPYEIADLLGAGGMGEVYRAHDSRLDRPVAIKVLTAAFAADRDRLHRFEQEARAAAALNHPGVLAVYDVGVHQGTPYLVTELLAGTTLRERLERERLSVRAGVDYGTQIAQALAAAHDRGIVHRDLKPDNLFVTADGRVKILDFGLAKLTAPFGPGSDADRTREGTLPNTVLGTVGYMAPEQARGLPADHRADIFAFGAVLYEMLAGRRAFQGDTATDVISAILKDPPPDLVSTPGRLISPAVDQIVRRCVEKDPGARFQSSSDLAFALDSLSDVSTRAPAAAIAEPSGGVRATGVGRRWLAATLLALVGIGAIAIALAAWRLRPERGAALEFLMPPPARDQPFAPLALSGPGLMATAPQVGVSPDGRSIALVAADAAGVRRLWIRALDAARPRLIERTDGIISWPFWSPDSRSVVFASHGTLRRIDVANGTIERLCALPDETTDVPFVTGSWSDDTILFSIGTTGLYRVSASGGRPERATTLDPGRGDRYHSWPQLLGGGRFLAFVRNDDARLNGVYAGRLDQPTLTLVMPGDSRAVFAAGHLLRTLEDRLVAQPFDPDSLRFSGAIVTLVPSIFLGAGRTPAFWVSDGGTLVYAVGGTGERTFRWIDRTGIDVGDAGPPGLYTTFDLSPDGSRIVTAVQQLRPKPGSILSVIDVQRRVASPLTLGAVDDTDPRFGPGGQVAFARNTGDSPGIMRVDAAGGRATLLVPRGTRPYIWMETWSSDGRTVIHRSPASADAWATTVGASDARRLTQTRRGSIEQVALSGDGQWIAYNTPESGLSEVYVSPVSGDGRRWQVSSAGGVQAAWRADGRELYYLGLDGGMYAVALHIDGDRRRADAPRLLFRSPLPIVSSTVEQYRVTGDGQRFLFCIPIASIQHDPLTVLVNWPARLQPHGIW